MTLRQFSPDEAPPPYTPEDPLTPSSSTVPATEDPQAQSAADTLPLYDSSIAPANFVSAAGYFQEHPPSFSHQPSDDILEHALTIYSRSKAKDYYRFPRCWRSRSQEISKHDWRTFLNHLLPTHLGPASNLPNLPPKLRAELERDQKDRPQESEQERRSRIAAVVSEWNDFFFVPRGTAVIYCYAPEDGTTPVSPLCPNCYPSSVRSLQSGYGGLGASSAATGAPVQPSNDQTTSPRETTGTAEPTERQSETAHLGTAEGRGRPRSIPPLGFLAGAVNTIHNWANRKAQLAQMYGEQAEAWGRSFGEYAEACGRAFGKHAELRGRLLAEQAEAWARALSEHAESHKKGGFRHQAEWMACMTGYPVPRSPWARGRGYDWTGARARRRSPSVSSSSSSCSTSSDEDLSSDDSVSTISSDSDWDARDVEAFRDQIRNLHQRREQSRATGQQAPHDVAGLRQELATLRAAHREFRTAASRRMRGPRGSRPFSAERRALREEIRTMRREYRALARQVRSELRSARKAQRKRRREERKAMKAARAEEKRAKRKQMGQSDQRDPIGGLETGVAHINIEDGNPSSSSSGESPPQEQFAPVPPAPEIPAPAAPSETACAGASPGWNPCDVSGRINAWNCWRERGGFPLAGYYRYYRYPWRPWGRGQGRLGWGPCGM
ncbi:hypothetical protein VTO42DRAFT_7888 [Malbranchea cinnamomea]